MLNCETRSCTVGCELIVRRRRMRIKVEKPSAETIAEMKSCPTWSKEVSVFDWEYDSTETCYDMEGEVKVTAPEGEAVEFGRSGHLPARADVQLGRAQADLQALSLHLGSSAMGCSIKWRE